MTQKEKELLSKLLPIFEQYDKKTVIGVINKLESIEFTHFLDALDNLFGEFRLNDNVSNENSKTLKNIIRFIKNKKNKSKLNEIIIIFERIFNIKLICSDVSCDEIAFEIEKHLQNEPNEKLIMFENEITQTTTQKSNPNSLENWSTLINKDSSSNLGNSE